VREDIWNFNPVESRERSITKIFKRLEQTIPELLIELSPTLFCGFSSGEPRGR